MQLDDTQIEDLQRQGWRIFEPGYDLSYRSYWNTPWYIVREFYQNALDEHDEIGLFDVIPTITQEPIGLVIRDQGRGIGAESLLLRETKVNDDLRGKFGEGLKFACLAALRLGYDLTITSSEVEIRVAEHQTTFGKKTVNLLAFLWKLVEEPHIGTTVVIGGYHGSDYKDRFIPLLRNEYIPSSKIFEEREKQVGRFDRQNLLINDPACENQLYVRDIYVKELSERHPSRFSYNLWNIELDPDRNNVRDAYQLVHSMCDLWAQCDNYSMICDFLQDITEQTYEAGLSFYSMRILPNTKDLWRKAWKKIFGTNAVLFTERNASKYAESYGYNPIEDIYKPIVDFLMDTIPTDKDVILTKAPELAKQIILISTEELNKRLQDNVHVLEWLLKEFNLHYYPISSNISAAELPLNPETGKRAAGLWQQSEKRILIDTDYLDNFWIALEIFYHELGHAIAKGAIDYTAEHTEGIQVAARICSKIILTESDNPIWEKIHEY